LTYESDDFVGLPWKLGGHARDVLRECNALTVQGEITIPQMDAGYIRSAFPDEKLLRHRQRSEFLGNIVSLDELVIVVALKLVPVSSSWDAFVPDWQKSLIAVIIIGKVFARFTFVTFRRVVVWFDMVEVVFSTRNAQLNFHVHVFQLELGYTFVDFDRTFGWSLRVPIDPGEKFRIALCVGKFDEEEKRKQKLQGDGS
jgi:hypothetical protein